MKRSTFIKSTTAATALGVISTLGCKPKKEDITAPNLITSKKYKWKMVTTWPPNFPVVGDGCNKLAHWINEMSGGRIEIKVFGAGELVPGLQVFEAVSGGSVEMGHGAAYYWTGIDPAFSFFSSVPFGMNSQQVYSWLEQGGGNELWREWYAHFNCVPFFAGNTGVQMGGWFNKRIDSAADFKGLKMRIPGLGGKVIESLGGAAVLVSGSELHTNLERGVIDALEWIGPYHDYLMGFHQIAKYYYYPGWHEPGSVLECLVNKRAYDALPTDLQAIIQTACYRANTNMLAEFESKNNEYLQKIINETKVEVLPFPDEVIKRLKESSQKIYVDIAAKPGFGKRVHDSYFRFKEQVSKWNEISEKAYYNQMQ